MCLVLLGNIAPRPKTSGTMAVNDSTFLKS